MFSLTNKERLVLLVLVLVFFCGNAFQYFIQTYPALNSMASLLDSDGLLHKLDVNTASAEEFEALPYIGKYTAEQIVVYRDQNGAFTSLDQLKKVKGIKAKNFQKSEKYLFIKK